MKGLLKKAGPVLLLILLLAVYLIGNAPDDISSTTVISGLDENGTYTAADDVSAYLAAFGHLPDNFITKSEAKSLGWDGGGLESHAPGKCIGGDKFGNYEGTLPEAEDRDYYECDIDFDGNYRGAKRIVYSNDGLIYYTEDHYESFEEIIYE